MICTVITDKFVRPDAGNFRLITPATTRPPARRQAREDMANAVLTILVIAVGAAADVGVASLLERVRPPRRKDRIRKAARLVWLLGFQATLLAAVPFAGYYLCALVTAPDDGYAAGWLLFFAGFIVLTVSGNRLKYRQDLKRLEAEDDTSASSPGGRP